MSANWWADKLGTPRVTIPPAVPIPQVPTQASVSTPTYQSVVTQNCPGCGSGNYGGTAETRARCYDCGYPIVQQGSGAISSGGPSKPAKQAQGTGFNPTTFINK